MKTKRKSTTPDEEQLTRLEWARLTVSIESAQQAGEHSAIIGQMIEQRDALRKKLDDMLLQQCGGQLSGVDHMIDALNDIDMTGAYHA